MISIKRCCQVRQCGIQLVQVYVYVLVSGYSRFPSHFIELPESGMPCSGCNAWMPGESIRWRRFDFTWWEDVKGPPSSRNYNQATRNFRLSHYQDLWWFFYCESCKGTNQELDGWYINADGHVSTDEDSDEYDSRLSGDTQNPDPHRLLEWVPRPLLNRKRRPRPSRSWLHR